MIAMWERWLDLPPIAKVAIVLVSGGGIAGAVRWFFGYEGLVILGVGVAIIALLFLAYKWVLKRLSKRKSKPFEQEIAKNSGATPRAVSDPSRRAQADSLRKKFEEGLAVYRQRGKDIYSVPWYVVIGETGSGKTQAIHNSGVGFPPGLHKELQGVGGTINMDWFFTNDAVLLDTAGSLVFGEVDATQTSEWKSFLGLLRRARPRCPINGVLLVIPADSLKNDPTDALEQKAKQISNQLDLVQQTLGVRFPLFLVITKSDKLVGFSEFFEGISDPGLQFQMVGWSNPGPLDRAFEPRHINDVLANVRDRVIRRRMRLLKEPAPQTMVADHRLDEVDALYEFPSEIDRIAPRLQRYLELIFAGGQWAAPPPFFRGLYFTSALREGAPVDLALAEAVGMEGAEADADRRWEKRRSFFLHDVFTDKVFRERGLVTAARSPSHAVRKRRTILYGSTAAMLVVLILATGWWVYSYMATVGSAKQDWEKVLRGVRESDVTIVDAASGAYLGDSQVPVLSADDASLKRATLAPRLIELAERPIRAPLILRPVQRVLGRLDEPRRQTVRAIYEASTIRPLVIMATRRFASEKLDGSSWSPQATSALTSVLALETRARGLKPFRPAEQAAPADEAEGEGAPTVLDSLATYVFDGEAQLKYQEDREELAQAFHQLYSDSRLVRPSLDRTSEDDLEAGVKTFIASWQRGTSALDQLGALQRLRDSLTEFHRVEDSLLAMSWFDRVPSVAAFEEERRTWDKQYQDLMQAWEQVNGAVQAVEQAGVPRDAGLAEACSGAIEQRRATLRNSFESMIDVLPPQRVADDANEMEAISARLNDVYGSLSKSLESDAESIRNALTLLVDRSYRFGSADGAGRELYDKRFAAYRIANEELQALDLQEKPFEQIVASALDLESRKAARVNEALKALGDGRPRGGDPDWVAGFMDSAEGTCTRAIGAGSRAKGHAAANAMLDRLNGGVEAVVATPPGEGTTFDAVALTPMGSEGYSIRAAFDPRGARPVFDGWQWMDKVTTATTDPQTGEPSAGVLDASAIRGRLNAMDSDLQAFADRYVKYWAVDVVQACSVRWTDKWSGFRDAANSLDEVNTNQRLSTLAAAREGALKLVPAPLLGSMGNDGLSDAVSAVELERRLLTSDAVRDSCRRMLGSWSGLSADPGEARAELLRLASRDFKQDFLVRDENGAASIPYWQSFVEEALRLLSEETKQVVAQRHASIRELAGLRPICRDGRDDATVQQIADLKELLATVQPVGGAAGEEDRQSLARTQIDPEWVEAGVEKLREAGKGSISNEQWLSDVKRIATWLAEKPQATIWILDRADQPDDTVVTKATNVVLEHDGRHTDAWATGFRRDDHTVELALPSSPVTMRFYDREGNDRQQLCTAGIGAEWSLFDRLWAAEAQAPIQGDAGPIYLFSVDLTPTTSGKQYWLGASFDEALPITNLRDWPKITDADARR